MQQSDALFGAEVSGHYFFRELEGGDDGLLAACRLIAYLGRLGADDGRLAAVLPGGLHYARSRAWRSTATAACGVIQQIRQSWSEHPQTTIDGVRIELPGGWALVRPA